MELPVLVRTVEGKGFVATVGPPFNWSAEGVTAEEAVAKVMSLNKNEPNPWLEWVGTLDPDDPVIQEWERYVEEYRQSIDRDPNSF